MYFHKERDFVLQAFPLFFQRLSYHNEHSGGCRRQPSTPAEGGRRAKLCIRCVGIAYTISVKLSN